MLTMIWNIRLRQVLTALPLNYLHIHMYTCVSRLRPFVGHRCNTYKFSKEEFHSFRSHSFLPYQLCEQENLSALKQSVANHVHNTYQHQESHLHPASKKLWNGGGAQLNSQHLTTLTMRLHGLKPHIKKEMCTLEWELNERTVRPTAVKMEQFAMWKLQSMHQHKSEIYMNHDFLPWTKLPAPQFANAFVRKHCNSLPKAYWYHKTSISSGKYF